MKNPLTISLACLLVGFLQVATFSYAQSSAPPACALDSSTGKACGLRVTSALSKPLVSPFQMQSQPPETTALRYVSADQLGASDRTLLQRSLPRIASLAQEQGFDFHSQEDGAPSGWSARQADCTALPDYLLLGYQQAAGTHSEAGFTVAIPRTGKARIHLVPVQRRGFTLYTSSRRNRITIVVFNDLLKDDARAVRSDWLGLGLCYAALAGDQVQAATTLHPSSPPSTSIPQPTYTTASLSLSWKQPPTITFVGLPPGGSAPRQWTLIFTPAGSLHKVLTRRAHALAITPAREDAHMETPVVAKGQVVDWK